jgi:hypothetical protein
MVGRRARNAAESRAPRAGRLPDLLLCTGADGTWLSPASVLSLSVATRVRSVHVT